MLKTPDAEVSTEIVITKERKDRFTIKCATLSISDRCKLPYRKTVFDLNGSQNFKFGDIVEISETGEWKTLYKYNQHNYDVCVVLDKINDYKVSVYGNKFGEKDIEIGKYHTKSVNIGDKLLVLNKKGLGDYYVVHNITRAIMKREIQKMAYVCNLY